MSDAEMSAVKIVLEFAEKWADGSRRDREAFETAAPLVRALCAPSPEAPPAKERQACDGPGDCYSPEVCATPAEPVAPAPPDLLRWEAVDASITSSSSACYEIHDDGGNIVALCFQMEDAEHIAALHNAALPAPGRVCGWEGCNEQGDGPVPLRSDNRTGLCPTHAAAARRAERRKRQ